MSVGDKIKKLRKQHGMTQAELAKRLGVAPTAVSAWEGNYNRPLMDKITVLAKMFEVPITFFFDQDNNGAHEPTTPYTVNKTVMLPIVGRISCGNGVLAYEDIEGYEPTPKEWLNGGKYFYLRAKGDSMVNARIQDGDLLLIRSQDDVENGEIAAVLINNEAVLKRVFKSDGTVILQSENQNYNPIILDESKSIKIIGKLKKVVLDF